jgi:uncharacterized protein YbcC (UPF0753/DUF2309 family)
MSSSDIHSILHEVAHILPTQGPIDVFIHHNTLHAFDALPFEEAVERAAEIYGAEAFLPEQRYLDFFRAGRITESDLNAIIGREVGDGLSCGGVSFHDLIRHLLISAPPVEGFQEVKWLLRESDEAVREQKIESAKLAKWLTTHGACINRRDALHQLNNEAAESLESILTAIMQSQEVSSHERTILWAAALLAVAQVWEHREVHRLDERERVLEEMINPIIIRFCEEYLDLGFSNQLMPDRQEGMLWCFLRMVDVAHFGIPSWLGSLRRSVHRYKVEPNAVEELVERLLDDCGIRPDDRRSFLEREALSLRGWAGYVALAERNPDLLHGQHDEIKPRFAEYVAIRLLLRLCASESPIYLSKCAELPHDNTDLEVLDQVYTTAYHVLCLFTSLNLGEHLLDSSEELLPLLGALLRYNQATRRRLWHLAYENNLYVRALDVLSGRRVGARLESSPQAQFVFCIDDREESIRRHIEACGTQYETFGTAGFFGVDANYTVMSGASAPYCPVIIRPTHAIREVPKQGFESDLSRYRKKQELWFRLSGYVNRGAGSWIHNMILSLAGCFSLIPMLLGVIAPKTLRFMGSLFGSEPMIPADLHELQVAVDPSGDSSMPGYTLEEMAARVVAVLRGIGLIDQFAPLVLFVGHGSSSRNNPLRSAYDCGACGGRPGRINSRAFCIMANDRKVRHMVREKSGIVIPETTHFLGSFHNTCSDQIEYFDVDRVPQSHEDLFARIRQDFIKATRENAFERCRRFAQAGIKNVDEAAEEALARSYMLAEARPEYGHATNALCIVGPRNFSKGLFFDRRSFLVSYDSSIDTDSTILLGILRAVVPVCGGINLEYLFSAMDNEVYGAGTKLPHNIVSLVGIMNGTSSDLRTGLPAQMIEIHEPVRQLLVVVATQEQLERVIATDAMIAKNFAGGWMRVVLHEPKTGQLLWRTTDGKYRQYQPSGAGVPVIRDIREWCVGKTGHLPFGQLQEVR